MKVIKSWNPNSRQRIVKLDDGRYITYGYRWSSCNDQAFVPASGRGSAVTSFFKISDGMGVVFAEQCADAGTANKAYLADRRGRKVFREQLKPLLESYLGTSLSKLRAKKHI